MGPLTGAECPGLATNGPPVARNRGPLCPQQETFSWWSLTSEFDPTQTFGKRLSVRWGVLSIGCCVVYFVWTWVDGSVSSFPRTRGLQCAGDELLCGIGCRTRIAGVAVNED